MAAESDHVAVGAWRKYERDIDVMLAEEFTVSAEFTTWFLQRTARFKDSKAVVTEVHVSMSDNLGESDLVVILQRPTGIKFALYIEDKITAQLQPEQEGRYRLRAETGVAKGLFSEFDIVLCAPRIYVENLEHPDLFDSLVSYEEVAEFLRSSSGSNLRMKYRAHFIETAVPTTTSAWKSTQDDLTDRFWDAAYEIAHREFRELEMKPLKLTKGSTWITFRTSDMPTMPQRIYVYFKGSRGQMDLTFTGASNYKMAQMVEGLMEPDMDLVKTGKSTAIRLQVEKFDVCEINDEVKNKLRTAFGACVRLIRFFGKHRDLLIRAAADSREVNPW